MIILAYAGYLIRINGTTNYNIPMEYMRKETYKCTFSTLDTETYRDGNGVLHRTAIVRIPHCSFETRKLNNTEISTLWQAIQSRYTVTMEKRVSASVYVMEIDDYITGSFYIPDTEMIIDKIENGKIFYMPVTFEFIGYGG